MRRKLIYGVVVSLVGFSIPSFFNNDTKVYICTGPKSLRYHYSEKCQGLRSCSKEIKEMSLEEARKLGKTICGFED